MKGRKIILFAAVVFAVGVAGCSALPDGLYDHSHGDHSHAGSGGEDANRQESLEYLIANFPTRDQQLRVEECITARTGYEFPELPEDFGPGYLLKATPTVTDDQEGADEADAASFDCILALGLEDRYFPPWDHARLRE